VAGSQYLLYDSVKICPHAKDASVTIGALGVRAGKTVENGGFDDLEVRQSQD
jgi:hypothetical protein